MCKCGNPSHMCPLGECFENSEIASQDDVYLQLYWLFKVNPWFIILH
jgi:hypothetical protein